jgi:hypothetical protein
MVWRSAVGHSGGFGSKTGMGAARFAGLKAEE